MKKDLKRRDFVTGCFRTGVTCCALVYGNSLLAFDHLKQQPQKPDPKSLCYCGYKCPPDCTLYKASVGNNIELKEKAYKEFMIKENYNIDFNPEKIFCFTCKDQSKPAGIILTSCSVRKCAIEKGYECCIECDDLAACDKELWKKFPKFKEITIKMQKDFRSA